MSKPIPCPCHNCPDRWINPDTLETCRPLLQEGLRRMGGAGTRTESKTQGRNHSGSEGVRTLQEVPQKT